MQRKLNSDNAIATCGGREGRCAGAGCWHTLIRRPAPATKAAHSIAHRVAPPCGAGRRPQRLHPMTGEAWLTLSVVSLLSVGVARHPQVADVIFLSA